MAITYKENSLPYDVYYYLLKDVNLTTWSQYQAENALERSYYAMTAYDGDVAVGMGRVVGDGMYFMIVDVVVMPEYQGRGIGRSIVTRLLRYIKSEMDYEYRVTVLVSSEPGTEGFFVKQGFRLAANDSCGPALRKIIYK